MISVVIPCYNAGQFIKETLDSIMLQGDVVGEIIVVDDGSTDQSASIIQNYGDSRISYIYQQNKGVSAARNNGLKYATGSLVIFFDADDKMSEGFLKARQQVLENEPDVDFCCGPVHSFPIQQKETYGVVQNMALGLLTYLPQYSSCPSNYLIRKSVLLDNKLYFNENLSSTADRFFLIQLETVAKGKLIYVAPLLYRITPGSMSNRISKKLIADNEKYFFELQEKDLIPVSVEKEFFFRINYILGMGFIRTGECLKGIRYAAMAFIRNPQKFINQII